MSVKEKTVSEPSLDRLGEFLVQDVRDRSIQHWKQILEGRMGGQTAVAARRALEEAGPCSNAVSSILPMIVDHVLHELLVGIEQNEAVRVVVEADGDYVVAKDVSDGLPGELFGQSGWIARFSSIR